MNSFEVYCAIPDHGEWHVNYASYPCCHETAVRAYPLLLSGYVPGTPEWEEAASRVAGTPPKFELSLPEQEALSQLLATASLPRILAGDVGGRWRHHLAMGLKYTAASEVGTHRLTHAWVPQLAAWFGPISPRIRQLAEYLRAPGGPETNAVLSPEDVMELPEAPAAGG